MGCGNALGYVFRQVSSTAGRATLKFAEVGDCQLTFAEGVPMFRTSN